MSENAAMSETLIITPDLVIPLREISFSFVRASGPGGQNVNKVATAVQLRFDAAGRQGVGPLPCPWLALRRPVAERDYVFGVAREEGEASRQRFEREVELGGPIHSKGVLILSGYLGARYAAETPLALAATIVFEQSYGGVDGDSASLAELCALLSAIAEAPVDQRFAVTGSVDQLGRVQAVGGVNAKLEGLLAVSSRTEQKCAAILPESNTRHLMLSAEALQAVSEERFELFAVAHVDEAMELLTGLPAGVADDEGVFPEGSLNRRVADRLQAYALRAKELKAN